MGWGVGNDPADEVIAESSVGAAFLVVSPHPRASSVTSAPHHALIPAAVPTKDQTRAIGASMSISSD